MLGLTGLGDGAVHPRLEIRQLQQDADQWNIFLLALQRFQQTDQSDRLSYYQVAGMSTVTFCSICTPNPGRDAVQNRLWLRLPFRIYQIEAVVQITNRFQASMGAPLFLGTTCKQSAAAMEDTAPMNPICFYLGIARIWRCLRYVLCMHCGSTL